MMTARALSGNVSAVISRAGPMYSPATLPTNYHKIPTLFLRKHNVPTPLRPNGGQLSPRHAVDDDPRTFVHVGHAEGGAPVEFGVIREQVSASGEDHLAARLGRRNGIIRHSTILGETADADEGDVSTHAVDAGRGAGAEGCLIIIVDLAAEHDHAITRHSAKCDRMVERVGEDREARPTEKLLRQRRRRGAGINQH